MGERQILDAVLKKEQPGFAKDLDGEHEKMGPEIGRASCRKRV